MRFPVLALLAAVSFFTPVLSAADGPSLAPPAGAISVVRDTAANYWALGPATNGRRELLMLPANAANAWVPARIPNLDPADWSSVIPQSDRTVLVTSAREVRRFDPRAPEKGASVQPANTPRTETVAPPWRLVSRMPSSNHDLSAAVVDGRLYIAGGMTWDWGVPAKNHFFDELWALEPKNWTWSIVTKFSQPRVYCSTAAFEGRVWIVGGDVIEPDGKRVTTTRVEVFDPRTGQLTKAPELPYAIPAPLTLAAGGRLWVVGSRNRDERGQMASIGAGESEWRKEPEALHHMWALAGAALDDKIYVCVPNTGLSVFDPTTKQWTVIPGPSKARSAQVAAWRGEIWIMGGTDVVDWSETRIYHPATRTWRTGPSIPARIAWGAAGVLEDQLVVAGGATPRNTPEGRTFDFSDRTFVLAANAIPPAVTVTEPGRPLPRWTDAKLRGTGEAGLPFTTELVYGGYKLRRLSQAEPIPKRGPGDTGRWLIVEAEGSAWTIPDQPGNAQPELFLDLRQVFGHPILNLAITFHPRFPAVPHAYVLYNHRAPGPGTGEDILARFNVVLADPPSLDLKSEQVLMRWRRWRHQVRARRLHVCFRGRSQRPRRPEQPHPAARHHHGRDAATRHCPDGSRQELRGSAG
jgi:N-acetylneuraminic acid mutarotase